MLIESLDDSDVLILKPKIFEDERGYFTEVFSEPRLSEAKIFFRSVQENQSFSVLQGTVRGLHFQREPFVQAKIVRVIKGRILDVAVDLRRSSPNYRKCYSIELTAHGFEQVYVPGGFAHGFCTLDPETIVAYHVDRPYSADCDAAILWNDASLEVPWPPFAGAAISAKDAAAPRLSDIPPPFA